MTRSGEPQRQHVVLCEGFDDRSFWGGWLLHRGCAEVVRPAGRAILDVWGRPIPKGCHAFTSPAGELIVVHPFGGKKKLRRALREYFVGQVYRPARVVVNVDSDAENGGSSKSTRQSLKTHVERCGGSVADEGYRVGSTEVLPVIWECADAPSDRLPGKQTLERLVCAALASAYPDRAAGVEAWLKASPVAEKTVAKCYAYSHMAKWHAEKGADYFFRGLWRDEPVADALRGRLEASGAWDLVERLISADLEPRG